MNFAVISLFPEIFDSYFNCGVVGRAIKNKIATVTSFNPRDYTEDKYGTVDDKPYGGGAGMVLKPEPLGKAIDAAKRRLSGSQGHYDRQSQVIYLTPQGKPLHQNTVRSYAEDKKPLILLCGRYEGLDERIIEQYVDEEYSIGDYVLSGGELPALVLLDAIIRLLPGALGDEDSVLDESFSESLLGLLEYPQYTRPSCYNNNKVPDVLQSGHHEQIKRWRQKQVLGRTWLRRPNLLECVSLTLEQEQLLKEFIAEYSNNER